MRLNRTKRPDCSTGICPPRPRRFPRRVGSAISVIAWSVPLGRRPSRARGSLGGCALHMESSGEGPAQTLPGSNWWVKVWAGSGNRPERGHFCARMAEATSAELRDPALALQNQSLEIPRTGPLVSPSPGVSLVMAAGGPTLITPQNLIKKSMAWKKSRGAPSLRDGLDPILQ